MAKTRDGIRADMLMYLKAAASAMDTLLILEGDSQKGVQIVRLATSFRQSDVLEEAVAQETEVAQAQVEEQEQQRKKE